MSKIHSLIQQMQDAQLGSSFTSFRVPIADKKVRSLGQEKSEKGQENRKISSNQYLSDSSQGKIGKEAFGGETVKFSRFAAWHLVHMADNREVLREVGENRALSEIYLQQQSSEAEEQQEFNLQAPEKKKLGSANNEAGSFNSPSNPKAKKQKVTKPKQTGLRKLSGKAFKIVKELGYATYKEVASRLIKEIVDDESSFDDEKQENNIKRRVYDALNVLIAMGILRKFGKSISYGLGDKVEDEGQKEEMQNSIEAKKAQIQQKKQFLKAQSQKLHSLAQLTTRNKTTPSAPQTQIPLQSVFILSQNSSNITVNPDDRQCELELERGSKVVHGVDVITQLVGRKEN